MEKISIVQRRRDVERLPQTTALRRAFEREEARHSLPSPYDYALNQTPMTQQEGGPTAPERKFCFELSEAQSRQLIEAMHLEPTAPAEWRGTVRLIRNAQNRIVFQFDFGNRASADVLTSDDVCRLLKISRSTLYKLVHESSITCCKIGNQLRFRRNDIDAFLAHHELEKK